MADTAPRRADTAALTAGLPTAAAFRFASPAACTAQRGAWRLARAPCWVARAVCRVAWVLCCTTLPECSAVLTACLGESAAALTAFRAGCLMINWFERASLMGNLPFTVSFPLIFCLGGRTFASLQAVSKDVRPEGQGGDSMISCRSVGTGAELSILRPLVFCAAAFCTRSRINFCLPCSRGWDALGCVGND